MLYAFNISLAFLAVLPFSGYLGKTIGQSLDLRRSLERFDFTLLGDFMNEYGQGFYALLDQTIGFVFLFFIASIFLMGGVLQSLIHSTRIFAYYDFWKGCGQYFWRLFRLTAYFFIFQGILLALCLLLFQLIAGSLSPFDLESEVPIIRAFWIVGPIWVILSSLILLIQDYSKIKMVEKNEFWMVFPIRDAVSFVFSHFLKVLPLYVLYGLTFLFVSFLYLKVVQLFQAESFGTILGMFVLGQLYILFRIGQKIANLAALNDLAQKTR